MSINFEQYYKGIVPLSIDRNNFQIKLNYNTTLTTTSGQLGINLANANTWTALQTFNSGITGSGNTGSLTAGSGILGTANTWTALQTFGNNISFGGATLDVSSLSSGQILQYNGTNWVNVVLASSSVTSLNGLSGVVDITTPNGTLNISTSGQDVTADINLANANTWTAEQTFNSGINVSHNSYLNGSSLDSANLGFFGYANSGYVLGANVSFISMWNNIDPVGAFIGENYESVQIGMYNRTSTTQGALAGNKWSPFLEITFDGEVFTSASVNADIGTNNSVHGSVHNIIDNGSGDSTWSGLATFNSGITGSGNTGSLTAGSGILGTANTWSALQTFGNNISIGGVTFDISSLSSGQILEYNGTNWVNANAPSTGVTSLQGETGALTLSAGTGISISGLTITNSSPNVDYPAQANTWSDLQTFNDGITVSSTATFNDDVVLDGSVTFNGQPTFRSGVLLDTNMYVNGTNLTNSNFIISGYPTSGIVLGEDLSFISLWNGEDNVGGFIGEIGDSIEIGIYNRTSTTQGVLSGNTWSPFLGITNYGEVYTSANRGYKIGTTTHITSSVRNVLDNGSGGMSLAGGLTVTSSATFKNNVFVSGSLMFSGNERYIDTYCNIHANMTYGDYWQLYNTNDEKIMATVSTAEITSVYGGSVLTVGELDEISDSQLKLDITEYSGKVLPEIPKIKIAKWDKMKRVIEGENGIAKITDETYNIDGFGLLADTLPKDFQKISKDGIHFLSDLRLYAMFTKAIQELYENQMAIMKKLNM